jgi:excinuclease ABC subunit C
MNNINRQLEQLPREPGVYLYKDIKGQIIYVGKAAILKNRVRQYFQKSRPFDPKTTALVKEIADLDYITVETEIDALFLEAELVRRYQPRYNILLRDDKSTSYIRIDIKSEHPTVTITRRPLDDGAEYFGPYFNSVLIRTALKQLRKVFPYSTHTGAIPKRACLMYQIGLCPGLEEGKTSLDDYRKNLKQLISYIKGNRVSIVNEIEVEMKQAAKSQDYELASRLRNQLFALKGLKKSIVFSRQEFMDISKDEGLSELAALLGLAKVPKRIEGYDISHMSGTDTVASMVVFSNGMPNKTEYRKFKMMRPGNDDFAHMNEVINRRLSPTNVKKWGKPDLFLIDGGKGQLSSASNARDNLGFSKIPMIGLAKREEEIVLKTDEFLKLKPPKSAYVTKTADYTKVELIKSSNAVKLLQRIRDESHRFAVSYHSVLKRQRQTASILDEIPSVGPATRKKLLKHFGSTKQIISASQVDLEKVVGKTKAVILIKHLKSNESHK